MKYVESIANLQTIKFKDTGDVDSDSDSEIVLKSRLNLHQVSLTSHAKSAWTERLMQSFSHVVTVYALHVEIFLSSKRSHATSGGGIFGVSRGFT